METDIREFTIYRRKQEPNYAVTARTHQGRPHMVVPVTMMVEGVHNGNHGAIFHSIDELGRFPESWNGMPVVIDHPEINGLSVSANHPDIVDTQAIGRVYNSYVDGNRLRAEVWIDEEKLKQLSATLIAQLQAGELIEVSLGMFCDEENSGGNWNGENYSSVARNHRPDHLALLPGSVGACSCADGCGIRLNKEGGEQTDMGNCTTNTVTTTGTEFDFTNVNTTSGDGITILSENNLKQKEDLQMAEEVKCTPCVQKKVDVLIANEHSKFTEDDREKLESFDEMFLDKLAPEIVEIEKTVEVNVLSTEDAALLAEYKAIKEEKRKTMIKTIQDNSKPGTWTDDDLGEMKDAFLEKMIGMTAQRVADYSLRGGFVTQGNECTEEPLLPTGMKLRSKT